MFKYVLLDFPLQNRIMLVFTLVYPTRSFPLWKCLTAFYFCFFACILFWITKIKNHTSIIHLKSTINYRILRLWVAPGLFKNNVYIFSIILQCSHHYLILICVNTIANRSDFRGANLLFVYKFLTILPN